MKPLQSPLLLLRRFRLLFSVLFVAICALWCAQGLILALSDSVGLPFEREPVSKFIQPAPLWGHVVVLNRTNRNDDDSVRISQGLAKKTTFASTFGYWTGSWAGGDLGPPTPFGPYFRPLTSQLWWLQRHFAGPNSLHLFLLMHLLWHLAFTLALWALLRVWWSDKGALLCIWVWCIGASDLLNRYATPFDALTMWKDDPEMTVGLCVLGAMAAMRMFVLTSRRRWIVVALSVFALSLSFKESGYVTPFFVAFTLWRFRATKRQWYILPVFFGAAILAFSYRMWALQGMGGYHGSNGSWWRRAINELGGGSISASAWSGALMPVCVAALVLGVFHWWLARRKIAVFWLVVSAVAGVWSQANIPEGGNAWLQLLDISLRNSIYLALPTFLLSLILWQLFLLKRPRAMVWGYIWLAFSYLPLLKQAVTAHGFYFFSVGWAIWIAGAIAWFYSQGQRYLQSQTVKTATHETHARINALVRRPKTSGPA